MHQQPSRAGERRHCHLLRSHRIQLPTSAVNATLLAFAAAAPLLLLGGPGGRRCRSISPAGTALSSKPAAGGE